MTVAWLGVLLVIDYTKNPHLRAAERMPDNSAAGRPEPLDQPPLLHGLPR